MYNKLIILNILVVINGSTLPEIITYAKVSHNGATSAVNSAARHFSASSGYSTIPNIKKGEIVDYSTSKKYSTLDEEMVAKLDAKMTRKQAQDRFHPPANFEHVLAHSNKLRLSQNSAISTGSSSSQSSDSSSAFITSGSYTTLPKQLYTQYPGHEESGSPSINTNNDNNYSNKNNKNKSNNDNDNNEHLPSIVIDDYSPVSEDSYSQVSDSYGLQDSYQNDEKLPSFINKKKQPIKPEEFTKSSYHPSYFDDPYLHNHDHDNIYPHELIYDHPPDHYDHDYTTTTTEAPEMNDQRLSKRPYSYYYIGKKLWYLPLYFSIYFIIYIAALILKSIARHKINFPANLAAATGAAGGAESRHLNGRHDPGWWDLFQRVIDGIEKYAQENVKQLSRTKNK